MTIDIASVTSQKIALGFVEVPACQRLREHAATVPSDQAIVEIGAYKGRSTGWLALGATEGNGAHVYSVDCWDERPADDWPDNSPNYVKTYSLPETEQAYQNHLDITGIRDLVTPIKGFSVEVAKSWKKNGNPKIGLLWHDGAHHLDEVLADLKAWLPLMAPKAVVVLHDAGTANYGVNEAAEEAFKRRTRWDWAGRQVDLWLKNGVDTGKRGTLTIRTK